MVISEHGPFPRGAGLCPPVAISREEMKRSSGYLSVSREGEMTERWSQSQERSKKQMRFNYIRLWVA